MRAATVAPRSLGHLEALPGDLITPFTSCPAGMAFVPSIGMNYWSLSIYQRSASARLIDVNISLTGCSVSRVMGAAAPSRASWLAARGHPAPVLRCLHASHRGVFFPAQSIKFYLDRI